MANIKTRTSATNAGVYAWKPDNTTQVETSPSLNQNSSDVKVNQSKRAFKLKEAREKTKAMCHHIKMDYDSLNEEVSSRANYMAAQDHITVKVMKLKDTWNRQIKQIAKDFIDLSALTNTYNISSPDLNLEA